MIIPLLVCCTLENMFFFSFAFWKNDFLPKIINQVTFDNLMRQKDEIQGVKHVFVILSTHEYTFVKSDFLQASLIPHFIIEHLFEACHPN